MRINDLNSSGIGSLSPAGASAATGIGAYGQSGRAGYGQSADQVQLSGASRLAAGSLAEHSARIAQLKGLVATGQYDPSAEAVSRSLLEEAVSRTAAG